MKSLSENMEIVIRQADKGGGVVVQDYKDYDTEAMTILSDMDYYIRVEQHPSPAKRDRDGNQDVPIIC